MGSEGNVYDHRAHPVYAGRRHGLRDRASLSGIQVAGRKEVDDLLQQSERPNSQEGRSELK